MTEGVFPKVNGDILYASEVNTFYNGLSKIKTYTNSGTGLTTASTTITTTTSGLLIGIRLSCNFSNPTYQSWFRLKITGSNLGTYYGITKDGSNLYREYEGGTITNDYTNVPNSCYYTIVGGITQASNFASYNCYLKLLDTTTTITLERVATANADGTFGPLTLEILYIDTGIQE